MKRNTDPAFVGIQALKDKQRQQLAIFQQAAARGDWMAIHHDHYDWWMFPTDEPSSYGVAWTVYEGDIDELKRDADYLHRYLLGVDLLAKSWGWTCGKPVICLVLSPANAGKAGPFGFTRPPSRSISSATEQSSSP